MRNPKTFEQAAHLLRMVVDSGTTPTRLQDLYDSGLLGDLLKVDNPSRIDRHNFRKVCGLNPLIPNFDVWQTITIGGKSRDELLSEIDASGMLTDSLGMATLTTLSEATSLRLARVNVGCLGFTTDQSIDNILNRIEEFGHCICPAEVGPHLRLALKKQGRDDEFWLAMDPVNNGDQHFLFHIKRDSDGGLWLSSDRLRSGAKFSPMAEIVFVLRDKK